jgi:hypothetical protein
VLKPVSSVDKNMLIPVDKDFENLNVRYDYDRIPTRPREFYLTTHFFIEERRVDV